MSYTVSTHRQKELVQFRRTIHSNPELMFQEKDTSALVVSHLKKEGFSFESGIAETGVVCLIDSGLPGKTLLVRADMDALPIHEENITEYSSRKKGVMHACGHDAHTSILMGLASDLRQDLKSVIPKGRVLLVFQPAEEGGGGADRMVEAGVLEKYSVDAALALHVWNHVDIGKVGVVDGTMMASVDEFRITVKGKSGHGAMPQHTVDPVTVSAYIITALQTIVSRNTDPLDSCVVTVGSLHSGDAFNAIPDEAKMVGTVRTYSKEVYDKVPDILKRIVTKTAESFGASAEVEYIRVNQPTINTPAMADIVRKASRKVLGPDSVTEKETRTMGGEDFSAFLAKVPGCYFFIGSRNEAKGFTCSHHNSKFDFDEDALSIGLAVMKEAVRIFLSD
ncbi:MAG TPA: amidohydrolase [Leptospiraceae bacterium]|nr:amidohydrolase [Leptospiraceae bacterium]HMZ58096.1 amidohydrolase [Leptospiraceae bacterium]HNF12354.1 amidohydrolase [Leptospiraceae bacterium]HNF26507.1 amidohydrolase [Leptospiraceae bacterium]HNH06951.1 amidohydrolase [Leptospiraceae bacterium]